MNGDEQYLGLVQNGMFIPLSRKFGPSRLTKIGMQEAINPEAREIKLADYDGSAIMA